MKLLATRDMNLNDPLPNLGKALPRPTPATRPARETRSETNPEIIIRPDGKMETAIPGNAKAAMPVKTGPINISEPQTFRFSPSKTSILQNLLKEVEPCQVKVGDCVRILVGQPGIAQINEMIGTVQVVTRVDNSGSGMSIGDWSFCASGCEDDQTMLVTEFVE